MYLSGESKQFLFVSCFIVKAVFTKILAHSDLVIMIKLKKNVDEGYMHTIGLKVEETIINTNSLYMKHSIEGINFIGPLECYE